MKRIFAILVMAILFLGACDAATGITVSDAWARPAGQDSNGAVYLLLENHSAGSDELTGAFSDVARAVEIHESKMDGDVMQMQQLMSVSIKGKASVEFAPGGLHIMLIDLKQELEVGDEFQIILQFREHEAIAITVPVQETESSDSMSDH